MADQSQLSPEIQKALADPKFHALGPEDQVAVLKHLHEGAGASPAAVAGPAAALPTAPKATSGDLDPADTAAAGYPRPSATPEPENLAFKFGRGALLGAAAGAGIPEATTGKDVVKGAVGNAAEGYYGVAKAGVQDAYNVLRTAAGDVIPGVDSQKLPDSHLYGILDSMAKGLEGAGSEAWKGLKDKDPEAFAHGFGSAVTQLLTMRESSKVPELAVNPRKQLAKVSAAIGVNGEQFENLEKAMPAIVKTAQSARVQTVGDFAKTVDDSTRTVDQTFNLALAPVAKKPYIPVEIQNRILGLITPDMAKTPEGRADAAQIRAAARPYTNTWTIGELNAKRMTENANLTSYFNQDTRGQAGAKLTADISKAVRDGAAKIVYDQMDKAHPGADFTALKQQHGALWGLSDFLREKLPDLKAKQAVFEGTSAWSKLRGRASAGQGGVHGYVSGVGEAVAPGPITSPNANIRSAFGGPSLTTQAANLGLAMLPISALMGQNSDLPAAPKATAKPK